METSKPQSSLVSLGAADDTAIGRVAYCEQEEYVYIMFIIYSYIHSFHGRIRLSTALDRNPISDAGNAALEQSKSGSSSKSKGKGRAKQ